MKGAFGTDKGAATIANYDDSRFVFVFLNMNDINAGVIEHEFLHHFLGQTLGKTNFFTNFFFDEWVNLRVLPNVGAFGSTIQKYSQEVLNPEPLK